MIREGKPLPLGVVFTTLTGAESALCLVSLLSGNYPTFIPVIFPTLLAAAALTWPAVILLRLCGAFHILTASVLFLGLCVQSFSAGPWTVPPTARATTVLLTLLSPTIGIISIFISGEIKSKWMDKARIDGDPMQRALPASSGARPTVGSDMAIASDGCDILELPSSLDNSPRSTERMSSPDPASSPKHNVSQISIQPFASLMAKDVGTAKSVGASSPRLHDGMKIENVRLPHASQSPPLIMYSPYSSPEGRKADSAWPMAGDEGDHTALQINANDSEK